MKCDSRGTRAGLWRCGAFLVPVLLLSAACNWELNVYRTLAVAQTSYQSYWETVVTLHEQHVADDDYYAKAEAIAQRIYNLGKSTTALMVSYRTVKDADTKARIDAAIIELPQLVEALAQMARGIHPHSGANGSEEKFLAETLPKLERIEADLDAVEALR